jgi:hypothetical protein
MSEEGPGNTYSAERVEVSRSAIRSVTAASAKVEQSLVQRLSGDAIEAEKSCVGVANGATVELEESVVGFAAGDYVKVEESRVFLLLAPRVSGNVRAVVTIPAAFAFGAGYFLARKLFLSAFGRKG